RPIRTAEGQPGPASRGQDPARARGGGGSARRQSVHLLLSRAVLLPPARSGCDRSAGGSDLAHLITGLAPERVAANLARVREEIAATGRDPAQVEVLAATKYLPSDELSALAEAGVR